MNPILHGILRILRFVVDIISEVVFSLISSPSIPLPPIRSPLLLDSASTLAKKIREGKVSSKECVDIVIQRIEEINPITNAVVHSRYEDALREATEVDLQLKELSSEELALLAQSKPFLGVPFSCKDCFQAENMAHTAGLFSRRNMKASEDAPVVARMKNAGGILVCVSNVSELCMWMESSNTVTGRTNNPYHTGRIAGGSSGGEGSLIGACSVPFGIGSDVGGSIRMPAFFNGIFGHKPSTGLVPNTGQIPTAVGKLNEYLVTGPLCRSAEDLEPMLRVLMDSQHLHILQENVDVGKLKFYYMEGDGGHPAVSPVHPELKTSMRNFLAGFKREFGIKAERVNIPELFYSLDIWMNGMASEPNKTAFCAELAGGKGVVNPWVELIKWIFNLSHHTLPALGLGVMEKFVSTTSKEHHEYLELGHKLKARLDDILGDNGVLIYPSHSTPAPYHSQPILKTFNFAYTAVFNILGLPVTQVPLGLGSWGVPLGVQVVGGTLMDRNTLAVAREAERIFGGWYPPSQVL